MGPRKKKKHAFFVFLNIEAAQKHDCFFSVQTTVDFVGGVDAWAREERMSRLAFNQSSSFHSQIEDM